MRPAVINFIDATGQWRCLAPVACCPTAPSSIRIAYRPADLRDGFELLLG